MVWTYVVFIHIKRAALKNDCFWIFLRMQKTVWFDFIENTACISKMKKEFCYRYCLSQYSKLCMCIQNDEVSINLPKGLVSHKIKLMDMMFSLNRFRGIEHIRTCKKVMLFCCCCYVAFHSSCPNVCKQETVALSIQCWLKSASSTFREQVC